MTISLYRPLLALTLTALAFSPGCSVFKDKLNPENLNELDESKKVAILYRTESDRLNVAGGSTSGMRQVTYQGQPQSLLPPVSLSTLKVMYPHPEGRPDHARAFVAFSPIGDDSATEPSVWTKLTGFGSETEKPAQPFEVRALDVPKYQIDGIVAKLQKANFFRRSKVLNSKTYLGVSLDDKGFGKNYRNVDELDALILRVRQQGWLVGRNGKPLPNRGPMVPRQQPGVYQARAQMPQAPRHWSPAPIQSYGNDRAHQQQPPGQVQPGQNQAGYHHPNQGMPNYGAPQNRESPHGAPQYGRPAGEQPRFEQPGNAQRMYERQPYAAPPQQQYPPAYSPGRTPQR